MLSASSRAELLKDASCSLPRLDYVCLVILEYFDVPSFALEGLATVFLEPTSSSCRRSSMNTSSSRTLSDFLDLSWPSPRCRPSCFTLFASAATTASTS